MPPTNGNKVSQKELYAAIIAQSEERQEMERRLVAKMDTVIGEVRAQNTTQGEAIARLCEAGEYHEKRLDKVDARDKWGSIISGIGIAVGTALGVILGPKR